MNPCTRRGFLASSLTPVVAALAGAGERRPTISFGFSLYGMRSLKLEDGLARCAKIGYDAVELAALPGWPADPAALGKEDRPRLRRRLNELRLTLPALMENTPLLQGDAKTHRQYMDRLAAAAELGHALSPDAPPIIETVTGGTPGSWDKVRRLFADRLADWAKLGEKARTVIAIKPHRLGALNHPDQVLWLFEQVKSRWIKVAYDYSHFQFRDLSVETTLKALLPHTCFVHVKDVRLDKETVRFLLPGEGKIDYVDLFTRLRDAKYQGCVCVEVSGQISGQKGYDPEATARRCYDNLAPAFRKAGLR